MSKGLRLIYSFLFLTMASPPALAEMFKCSADDGSIQYQDRPCDVDMVEQHAPVQEQFRAPSKPLTPSKPATGTVRRQQDPCMPLYQALITSCSPVDRNNQHVYFACIRERLGPGCQNLVPESATRPKPPPRERPKLAEPTIKHRLLSCDPASALAATEEVIGNTRVHHDPELLFYAAITLYREGRRDESVFWYNASKLRARYDATLGDTKSAQMLTVMGLTLGSFVNNHAMQDTVKLSQTLDRVYEWDKKTPNPSRVRIKNQQHRERIDRLYASLDKTKERLEREKATLEAKAKKAAPVLESRSAERLAIGKVCRKTGTYARRQRKS